GPQHAVRGAEDLMAEVRERARREEPRDDPRDRGERRTDGRCAARDGAALAPTQRELDDGEEAQERRQRAEVLLAERGAHEAERRDRAPEEPRRLQRREERREPQRREEDAVDGVPGGDRAVVQRERAAR